MKHTDFMTIAGAKWNTMTDDEKAPYEKMAAEDKIRAQTQKDEYAEKGWYTNKDGTRSEPSKETKQVEPESDDEPVRKVTSKKAQAAKKAA